MSVQVIGRWGKNILCETNSFAAAIHSLIRKGWICEDTYVDNRGETLYSKYGQNWRTEIYSHPEDLERNFIITFKDKRREV